MKIKFNLIEKVTRAMHLQANEWQRQQATKTNENHVRKLQQQREKSTASSTTNSSKSKAKHIMKY